jgi:hypothetical protein
MQRKFIFYLKKTFKMCFKLCINQIAFLLLNKYSFFTVIWKHKIMRCL